MKTVELLLNDYIGDNYNPSRQTKFTITEECLTDYLKETEDDRNVKMFFNTYDSDESSVIYDYASMMEEFYQKKLLIVMTLLIDTKILYAERRCLILICQQKIFQVRKIIIGQCIKRSKQEFHMVLNWR